MVTLTPRAVDISHHNNVNDFGKVAAAGIWGVINKASQGTVYKDPTYGPWRRTRVLKAGMLWGAYHFNTGDNVQAQVKNFFDAAQPDKDTLMVLDLEDNRSSNMTIKQAVEFLHRTEDKLGRKAAIYSGNRLKETIDSLNKTDRAYVCSHRLWLCQYGPVARVPKGFDSWWLWQFTGDGVGPLPHSIPGIDGNGIDLNTYRGTRLDLAASWSGRPQPDLVA